MFEENADAFCGIGNDQGTLRKMQYYVESSGNHIKPRFKEITIDK